jgi:hypothetical protein
VSARLLAVVFLLLSTSSRIFAATTQTGLPLFRYGVYAVSNTCGAITFSANQTDSFDSSQGTYAATKQNSGGNIGTNGNITLNGQAVVNGTGSTPHTTTGSCTAQSITGLTSNGGATVSGGMVVLAGPLAFADPPVASPLPPTTNVSITGACGGVAGCTALDGSKNLALAPGPYGNLSITGGTTIHLRAGSYNINSIEIKGNSSLTLDSTPVLINVAGQGLGASDAAVDFTGDAVVNPAGVPSGFQIVYGGSAEIRLAGGASSYGVVYAPNAPVSMTGRSDWYGALIASTIDGNVSIHFDRALLSLPLAITATPDHDPNGAGWNNVDVRVDFACGGVLVTACSPAVSVTTEGARQRVSGTARDIGGNAITVNVDISLDKTPPVVIGSRSPAANARGWNKGDVTVSFPGTDSLSGIAGCTPNVVLSAEASNQSATGTCTDVAGNTSSPSTVSGINIDKTPPAARAAALPQPNTVGWNRTDVTVTFTGTDALSGVLDCSAPATLSSDGIDLSATGTCTDRADNVSVPATAQGINIDKTAPVLSVTSPADGARFFISSVTATGTVTDALSGVVGVSCNGAAATVNGGTFNCALTLNPGANSVVAVATDAAGNTTTIPSRSVNYIRIPTITLTSPANLAFVNVTPTTVTGTVDDTSVTSIMINAVQSPVSNGRFSAPIPLAEGPNILTATVTSSNGASGTASIEITLDTTPPHVTITSPPDRFTTTDTSISVAGNINDIVVGTVNDQQASVTVNGVPAQVGNRTFLAANIHLNPGDNTIQATGRDRVGNFATTQIIVTQQTVTSQAQIRLISGNNQTGIIGTVLPAPLVIALTDAAGNPAANKPVIFRVTQNNGMIGASGAAAASSVVATTNAQGQAQAQWTLGLRAGAGGNTVEAYSVGFAGTALFTASGNLGTAGKIVVDTGNHQIGPIGQALPKPLIAVVIDSGNNRLGGIPVTFKVSGGGGSFNGPTTTTVTTDSDGRAASTLTLGMQEGNDNNLVEATFPSNQGFAAAFTASGRAAGDPAATTISGVVLDNSNVPIQGVTIRAVLTNVLNSNPTSIQSAPSVQTNAQGQFSITPAPVGLVKLLVDGSTAQRTGTYPSLEYDVVTVAGQTNTVGNSIYLLPLNSANQLCVTATTGGGTLTMPEAPGFSLTVSPGQVTFPGGSRTGCVSVTVVHGDKVPMVPGFGQQPRFIVTIQPPGAVFNPPAAITLPNVDGLAPRAVTEMYSYDHDISSFVAIGTGVVSDDGLVIRSSPGVGVLKSGWHCGGDPNTSGSVADCGSCKTCSGSSCVNDDSNHDANSCCYNGTQVPKQPIADLSQCPNRVPGDWTFQYDGCSLQPLPGFFRNNPAGGIDTLFSDDHLPNPTHQYACDAHDRCYQTCAPGSLTAGQEACDALLRDMALAQCARSALNPLDLLSGATSRCFVFAAAYYEGLSNSGLGLGKSAFEDRQKQVCKCCQ